jgi:endo-1,4-beta-xylanase
MALSLKNLADFPIGIAVSAGNENNSILRNDGGADRAVIEQHFDQLTAGNIMKMSYLHPSENTYAFEQADALVNYALDNNMTIHGHTLVWHSDYQIPNWMKNYSGNYATMLQQHVQTIATYYAGRVVSWDVVNEALADDGDSNAIEGYRNSLWYQKLGAAYIEQAFIAARAADPEADLYYNDYNMEGGQQKFAYLLAMIDDFQARNIPIDGVGFQMHINIEWPSTTQIKNAFQQVVQRGLKVKITELDIPVNTYANPNQYPTFTPDAAERQKTKYREVVAAYLEVVPAELRGGITVWGLRDGDSWLIDLHGRPDWPLLFNDQLEAKPALDGFAEGLNQ